MASSLEKFFRSKVKQIPRVEFVLLDAQQIIENSTGGHLLHLALGALFQGASHDGNVLEKYLLFFRKCKR